MVWRYTDNEKLFSEGWKERRLQLKIKARTTETATATAKARKASTNGRLKNPQKAGAARCPRNWKAGFEENAGKAAGLKDTVHPLVSDFILSLLAHLLACN